MFYEFLTFYCIVLIHCVVLKIVFYFTVYIYLLLVLVLIPLETVRVLVPRRQATASFCG